MNNAQNKILPAGPLMKEHRLIERMVALLANEAKRLEAGKDLDSSFLKDAVDFMKAYADQCHHGKEENILFRELAKKELAREHADIMNQLITDHKYGRKTVNELVEAHTLYKNGDKKAKDKILACLKALAALYPQHIEKEDKHFFLPCMAYFSRQEKDSMLEEFWDFDKSLVHKKYASIVEGMEKRK